MKKFLICALCALGITSAAKAQDMFDSGEMTPYFGARVSLDITGISGAFNEADIFNNGCGFTIGGYYNIPLYKNLYFEPGLGVFYNTVGFDYGYDKGDGIVSCTGSLRNWGFRIPLLVGYHFDFTEDMKVSVFTGPQLNYGLSMKSVYDLRSGSQKTHFSEGVYDNFHRLDAQWMFGAAYHYGVYSIGVSGGVGMTNIVNEKDSPRGRRNTFSITLGYRF